MIVISVRFLVEVVDLLLDELLKKDILILIKNLVVEELIVSVV